MSKKIELLNQVIDTDVYKSLAIKMSEDERLQTEKFINDFIEPFSIVIEALEQCASNPELMEELQKSFNQNEKD